MPCDNIRLLTVGRIGKRWIGNQRSLASWSSYFLGSQAISTRYALDGLMRDVPATIAVLTQLTALGVELTVDDFGTG
jgi:hypothetical protein